MSLLESLFPNTLREPAECEVRVDGLNIGQAGLNPLLREVSVDVARAERVEIEAVFGSDRQPVFHGYVRETKSEYPEDRGAATFAVTCQDVSMKLDREQRRGPPAGNGGPTSDQAILSRILSQHGLIASADNDPGMSHAGAASHAIQVSIREDAMQPDRIGVQFADRQSDRTVTEEPQPDTEVLGRQRLTSEDRGLPPYVRKLGTAGPGAIRRGGSSPGGGRRRAGRKPVWPCSAGGFAGGAGWRGRSTQRHLLRGQGDACLRCQRLPATVHPVAQRRGRQPVGRTTRENGNGRDHRTTGQAGSGPLLGQVPGLRGRQCRSARPRPVASAGARHPGRRDDRLGPAVPALRRPAGSGFVHGARRPRCGSRPPRASSRPPPAITG